MLRIIALALLTIFAEAISNPASAEKFILIDVTGDKTEKISGDCYLLRRNGQLARQRLQSKVPTRFWLPTSAVRCNFEKSDAVLPVTVTIIRNGEVEYRLTSRPPFKWMVFRSSGPWGLAEGNSYPTRPAFHP
ncbi:hypothetical protein [Sneathiella glossodoripedis]|uniref:hypothetical protein n=1 Tax=Sneathiella glossodoripedis TaxID=418853 RepID=UPI0011DCFB61|nr:hypothetical protein [Sneathiella glossodoripedis]